MDKHSFIPYFKKALSLSLVSTTSEPTSPNTPLAHLLLTRLPQALLMGVPHHPLGSQRKSYDTNTTGASLQELRGYDHSRPMPFRTMDHDEPISAEEKDGARDLSRPPGIVPGSRPVLPGFPGLGFGSKASVVSGPRGYMGTSRYMQALAEWRSLLRVYPGQVFIHI